MRIVNAEGRIFAGAWDAMMASRSVVRLWMNFWRDCWTMKLYLKKNIRDCRRGQALRIHSGLKGLFHLLRYLSVGGLIFETRQTGCTRFPPGVTHFDCLSITSTETMQPRFIRRTSSTRFVVKPEGSEMYFWCIFDKTGGGQWKLGGGVERHQGAQTPLTNRALRTG